MTMIFIVNVKNLMRILNIMPALAHAACLLLSVGTFFDLGTMPANDYVYTNWEDKI